MVNVDEVDARKLVDQMLAHGVDEGHVKLPDGMETGVVGFRELMKGTWLGDTLLPYLMTSKGVLIAVSSVFVCVLIYYAIFDTAAGSSSGSSADKSSDDKKKVEDDEQGEPLRDFTLAQLREFDGGNDNDKPIYVSLRGEVFDVSEARQFYGKGSGYHCFAGREASRALAKLSFDEDVIANTRLDDLNPMELNSLDDWIDKFRNYKCYPIKGKCSLTLPTPRAFTRDELKVFRGDAPARSVVPEGRIHAPIYLGFNGKVYDVSYGGTEYYGVGGPYLVLTGIDATRALAKMSFQPEDLTNHDTSDLTDKQLKVMKDWGAKFDEKYPVVGHLV